MAPETWINLAVAIGIGLLVGVERERRKGDGPKRDVAGVRTFTVSGLLGAVSWMLGGGPLIAATLVGVAILVAVAYWRRRVEDPGLTTEIALLLTVLLGGTAMGSPLLAAALGVALAALLFSRERIHHFVRSVLTERELIDAFVLAAAALIVLPIIPDRHMGPFEAFNPRILWLFVVLVMGMSAAGYVAQRALGPRFGLPVTGLAGGFVSGIAMIGSLGQLVRDQPRLMQPAVAGATLANVATIVRMAVVLAVTSPPTLAALALPLILAGVVMTAYGTYFTWRGVRSAAQPQETKGRAFNLVTALVLACSLSTVLFLAGATQAWYGQSGVVFATALAGFATSLSAGVSVASLVDSGHLQVDAAVVPILVALSTNTLTKVVVATVSNRRFALQVVPGLVLMIAAAWVGAWIMRVP